MIEEEPFILRIVQLCMSKQIPAQNLKASVTGEQLLFVFRQHIIAMRKGFYLLFIPFAHLGYPAAYLAKHPRTVSLPHRWTC